MNAGAAQAPDDDESAEASGWFTRIAARPGVSLEDDVSLERDSSLEDDSSLDPDVALAPTPGAGSSISLTVSRDAATPGLSSGPPDTHSATDKDSPLLALAVPPVAETPLAPPASSTGDRPRLALPFTGPGLTWLGGALVGFLVVGLGAASDLAFGGGLGTMFNLTFLLGCVLVASVVRIRALTVAVVLPPLLFAAGYGLETKTSGQTSGQRQMALDLATSLALQAPVLFIGTALGVAITLVRLAVHLIRR